MLFHPSAPLKSSNTAHSLFSSLCVASLQPSHNHDKRRTSRIGRQCRRASAPRRSPSGSRAAGRQLPGFLWARVRASGMVGPEAARSSFSWLHDFLGIFACHRRTCRGWYRSPSVPVAAIETCHPRPATLPVTMSTHATQLLRGCRSVARENCRGDVS